MMFSINNFVGICEQVRGSSHLLRKSLTEKFIFCAGQKLVCPSKENLDFSHISLEINGSSFFKNFCQNSK